MYDKLGIDNKVDAVRVAIATRRECPNRESFCNWKAAGRPTLWK